MDLVDIVKHRADPGIIILEPEGTQLYVNERAQTLAASFEAPELGEILQHMAAMLGRDCPEMDGPATASALSTVISNDSGIFALRPFVVQKANAAVDPSVILVLIEQISARTAIDLESALAQYDLTPREQDIAKLLFKGLCNKAIAKQLSIGPYTVKDHLRKIMLKLRVNSRIGIVSKLLRLS